MTSITQYTVKANGENHFYNIQDAEAFIERQTQEYISRGFGCLADNLKITATDCAYMSESGYTDVHPFEITRIVSDKCIEIRPLKATLLNADDLNFHVGGFAAHCSNQRCQEYSYESMPEAQTLRIRLNKRGKWAYKRRSFFLSEEPYKFYDYNF
ncbi:hypothetical protein A3709_19385 [Halioglobus sp. HI00S01]|uniref:hypothetical protein n=1 Tax=Halioglobus sp. HI00S01 TaxID=1822214 RepID=UPI0007C297D5|nr:hypothetical protein [Halioglobus sp. HI00S01]KZX57788.1 hypothetical protein A3709_19385 [Halioglobus sp. HI00S01]